MKKKKTTLHEAGSSADGYIALGREGEKKTDLCDLTICKAVKLLKSDFFFSYLYPMALMKEIKS